MTRSTWRLPLQFDPARLREDLAQIGPDEWVAHFNKGYYEGDWSGVALRAVRDAAVQLYPDPTADGKYVDTELLARCPYFAEVLAAFQCELQSVRLLRLRAGSRIREHRDYKLGLADGALRVHVPITSNPEVGFYLEGQRIEMGEGDAWYLDFNLPHRVENLGTTDRIHLVIDGRVNDWVRELFPAELLAAPASADPVRMPAAPLKEAQDAAVRAPGRSAAAPAPLEDPTAVTIVGFLHQIGLAVQVAALTGESFLPGILIADGALLVDPAQLRYPGDLLHEAGHLAVADPARRRSIQANSGDDPAEEMMAIAWSYAAALAIGLEPAVVFHANGYRGGAQALIDNFAEGRYIGLPMLQWVGMTLDAKQAAARDLPAYPKMLCWLRPSAEAEG